MPRRNKIKQFMGGSFGEGNIEDGGMVAVFVVSWMLVVLCVCVCMCVLVSHSFGFEKRIVFAFVFILRGRRRRRLREETQHSRETFYVFCVCVCMCLIVQGTFQCLFFLSLSRFLSIKLSTPPDCRK